MRAEPSSSCVVIAAALSVLAAYASSGAARPRRVLLRPVLAIARPC